MQTKYDPHQYLKRTKVLAPCIPMQVGRSDKGPDGKMALVVLKDEWRNPR
jgi:hypothetical protein